MVFEGGDGSVRVCGATRYANKRPNDFPAPNLIIEAQIARREPCI